MVFSYAEPCSVIDSAPYTEEHEDFITDFLVPVNEITCCHFPEFFSNARNISKMNFFTPWTGKSTNNRLNILIRYKICYTYIFRRDRKILKRDY
jgi:hypothetical protein